MESEPPSMTDSAVECSTLTVLLDLIQDPLLAEL